MRQQDQKKTVRFDNQPQQDSQAEKQKTVQYIPAKAAKTLVIDSLNNSSSKVKFFTQNDPLIKRKDTAQSLTSVLEGLKFAIMHLNIGTFEDKQQNYYLAYNGTIQILDICQQLRAANFQPLTIDYLGFCICTLEAHLVLFNIKYLEWRVKLYVELSKTYEEIGSNEVALRTIELCIKKVTELQNILEQDPPLPIHSQKIFENVYRVLRILEIKYKLQLGQLSGDLYKKKLDEYFQNDKEARVAAIVESLRYKSFNYVEQQGKSLSWKEHAIKQSFEIVKNEIIIINDYIKQQLAQIQNNQNNQGTEEQRLKVFQDKMQQNLILESRFKEATKSIPLEYHIELTMHSYDVGNMMVFEELSQSAFTRCKYRRIEVPYITDIKIVASSHPNPNIPNGYEKIDQDINEAQLKILMKKNRIFKEDKKEVQQQVDPKAKDAKKGAKDKEVKQDQKQEDDKNKVQEAIPGIKHQYTYILVKRSISPENAICGFKVLLAPEDNQNSTQLKNLIEKGWHVIESPVQQYTGVKETTKQSVYICFKCTKESLKEEEEKQTLLLDIKPVFAKSPLARPDFGYEKINIDLRQIPKEFIKHPDNDYLFLTYKSDTNFSSNERELRLLMNLSELEKSFNTLKGNSIPEIRALELDITFDQNKLLQLFQSIKECLEGPLGSSFYDYKKEFLIILCFYVWKKYMVCQIYQIDHLFDQALQQEITSDEMDQYYQLVFPLQNIYKIGLKMINLILVRDPTRSIIFFIKSTIQLSKILMQDDEHHEASQFLKTCFDMVVIYRDEQIQRGMESRRDLFIPYCITASNQKIGNLLKQMMISYVDFKNNQGCIIREMARKNDYKKSLQQDEQKEELTEILNFKFLTKADDNKDKSYFEDLPQDNYINQIDLLINTLQIDLIMSYYRCSIEEGKRLQKMSKISKKGSQFTSDSMSKKLSLNKGKSFMDTKKKLNTLQNDLQNAGRLPVPQPQIKDYEKILKNHANKNPYLMALLNMILATNQKNFPEKKYLLNQALQEIEQAQEMEQKLISQSVKDSVFICSTLLDNRINEDKSFFYVPFDKLYQNEFIEETEQPRTPILISRSSSSITLKLPPFNPKVNELDSQLDPGIKNIKSMVLYGKIAAHGVNVSATCTDLYNTGVRNQIGAVVQVRQLHQNEGYCFAVAGFNADEKQFKKIGETSDQIITLQPLPINQLYAYLAKQSYFIGDFIIASVAADKCIEFFVEKSKILDKVLDAENPILNYRIKQKNLKDVSNLEVSSLAESLFIKARCMQKIQYKTNTMERHKNICLQANLSLLALEACAVSQEYVLGKRILCDLYNNIEDIIKIKSKYLFQILIKMYIQIQEIPKQYWDSKFRQLSCKLIYEISVLSFQFNQISLGKLVIYQSTTLPNRKFKITPKQIEVSEDQGQAKGAQPVKGQKKEVNTQITEETKMIQKVVYILSESPSYQDFLEDALLNFSEEYGEIVTGFIDVWKENLDYYSQFIENGIEQIEQIKAQLSLKWSFWELMKEPMTALQKLQQSYKQYPIYIELLCKFARKQIEQNNLKYAKEILTQADQVTCESTNILQQIFQLKLESVQNDIAWEPQRLERLQQEQESNGDIENKAISIYTKYYQLEQSLVRDKYQILWKAEVYYLKSLTLYLEKQTNSKETSHEIYFELDKLDLEKMIMKIKEINVVNPKNMSKEEFDFFKELQNTLALAAFFSLESQSECQLKNIVKFAQNINIREQMNPFDFKGQQTSLFSLIIGDCLLGIFKDKQPLQMNLVQNLTKEFWFTKAEIQSYADFSCYVINALIIEEKYNVLSNFCKHFCNTTQHFFSNIVIPFMIHSITILEENAQNLTKDKEDYLKQKTQEFETWKNSKKRKNRAAMLTGEIPPEEQQYIQDKQVIGEQITILKKKQQRITDEKFIAQNVLQEIQTSLNQPEQQLFECQRLLEQFGDDSKKFQNSENIQQRKAHSLFENTLYSKYKNVIDMLIKRYDNQGLIRALSQIGDLYISSDKIKEAQGSWNQALDTIFQKLHSLQNQISVDMNVNERSCLQACIFLYKLSKFCYFDNFQMQRECLLFVCNLSFLVFKTQLVNPQTLIAFADTRNILLPQDLFNKDLNPIVCIQACDYLIRSLIDNDMHIKALPLIQIMDYIACRICYSDFYSTRAKLFKSIVLAKIGMINQSYQLILQVQQEKCGPIQLLQQSENLSLQKGANWFGGQKDFLNHMPFFQDQNKEVIEFLYKLELPVNFDQKNSLLNVSLFTFSKICILLSIHEQEIIDRPENNEQRFIMLRNLDQISRQLLISIQKQEESQQPNYLYHGPLSESDSREDRFQLLYRTRFELGTITQQLGLLTRAYFVYKQGVTVIQNHIFGYPGAENGKEAENEEVVEKDKKDSKKPGKDVKDNKKGGKDNKKEEIVQDEAVKFDYVWENLSKKNKRKHLNGFWFLKFKLQIVWIFYQQNRFDNCLNLIQKLKKSCEQLNEIYIDHILSEIQGRILIRQGKIQQGITFLKELSENYDQKSSNSGNLLGDLGEILYERQMYQEAKGYFEQSYQLFKNIVNDYRFINFKNSQENIDLDKIKINDKYTFPQDIIDQLNKKETKIRKDEKKGGTKEKDNKGGKGQKTVESVELKVLPLNQLQKNDFMQTQKLSLKDYQHEQPQGQSIYVKFLEEYIRIVLRLAKCQLALNQFENVNQDLDKIENFISGNFNLPLSFKLEFFYLQGLTYKRRFVNEVEKFYQPYIEKYLNEKNSKYKKLFDRIPFKDLPRNRYLLDLPNFSTFLKDQLIPNFLEKSKIAFRTCTQIIKGECIYYENMLKIEQILMEMSELILLQSEYYPRLGFKYIQAIEDENWERSIKEEKLLKLNFELEAFQTIGYAMQVGVCKKEIQEKTLANVAIIDPSKVPMDIQTEILESDYIYKKKYDQILFDETKNKKTVVNSLDLVSLLSKLDVDSRIMTFSGNKYQKLIQKIHRFLKSYHSVYSSKCQLTSLEITPKNDPNLIFIEDGFFKFKSFYCETTHQQKFIYILSRYNKNKIQTTLSKDEQEKLLITEEKDNILFGSFYISIEDLSNLELKANNLKTKLQEADTKVPNVKERDYRKLRQNYLEVINSIGKFFFQRNNIGNKKHVLQEYDINTDKNIEFLPKLSVQIIDIFVKMFGAEGIEIENHNLLILFRNYHKAKYR